MSLFWGICTQRIAFPSVTGRLIEVQPKLLMPVAENLQSETFPPVRIDVDYFAAGFFVPANDLEPLYLHSKTLHAVHRLDLRAVSDRH